MPLAKRNLAVCALFAISALSQAWIDTGHMLVATIAAANLKPKVRAECDRLLKNGADERNADFVTTSPWADDVRRDRPETGPWHYIDYHFRSDGKPTTNQPDAENAVWAIRKFSAILKDHSKPDAERSEALRYLIHFVGDIHQPLHATARDSDEHPNGDKGGNDFRIGTAAIFAGESRPPRNLHSFWDFGGGLFKGERRPLSRPARERIDTLAQSLMERMPMRSMGGVKDMNPENWAKESFQIAKTLVYDLPENSVPSDEYVRRAQNASSQRITLAGYRLARLLNELLK
ncbi:MAG: S1/P1 nuclease [Fimbriimonas sp.]|nr:S1/P1 nuclease [Fimbriimonas sp.]